MSSTTFSISVKRVASEPWTVLASADATVGWLRSQIKQDLSLSADSQLALCHRGAVLDDDEKSLEDAGLVLHPSVIAVPLPGGAKSGPAFSTTSPTPSANHTAADAHRSRPGSPPSPVIPPAIDDDDAPMCRICFDCESSPSNRLITPCRCSGSMRFVHARCLNEWRLQATGALRSRCDQCREPYVLRYTRFAPLLRSPALVHVLTLAMLVSCVGLAALLPFALEKRFFALVSWRPWGWLARRAWAMRLARGLLVVAANGLLMDLREVFALDHATRGACLRCLVVSCAANGPRILRVLALVGVLHSLSWSYLHAQRHLKRALLQYGEVLGERV